MSPASEPASPFLTSPTQEGEITRAVAAVPAGAGDHQDVVELADQRLWLSVYIPPDANDHWPAFAGAVAQRAALSSERLLPVVASGNADGRLYVAYELGAAVPLSAYRASSELSTQRCLALLLGISRALDDAVSQGSPPYAATPESIFVDARRGAVIGDLGVAREALGNPRAELDRHAPWVAPEVLRGEGVHARSPVYSFGALTYTMFTGAPPAVDGAPGGEHPRLSATAPPRRSASS